MGTHPIFESDFDCLTEMSNFDTQLHQCSRLYAETTELIGRFHATKTPSDLEQLNLAAVKKLGALRNATGELKEVARVEGDQQQNLKFETMDKSVLELRGVLKKRLAEVEARLALQGRDELGLTDKTGRSGPSEKVDGKEAAQRLGHVNTQLGQIINRSQATNERLVDSSQVLRDTHGEQASGSDYLKNANRILDKLKRRKQIDNILFAACLAFFIATCVYILLRRFTPMFLFNTILYFVPTSWTPEALFDSGSSSGGSNTDESHVEL